MTPESNAQLLQKASIFGELPPEALTDLGARMQPREYVTGSIIVGQEDKGDTLYVINSGKVKVVLYGDNGREIILSLLRAGEIFGEMSLFDNQPRSASVIAVEPTRAMVLERSAFARHLTDHPPTAIVLLAEMSRRLRQADRVIGNLALLDVYGRVARLLKDLAAKEGTASEDGIVIKERPTQQEIASMIGTSRETVSRALNDFQKRGLLVMTGKQIVLRRSFETVEFEDE